MRRTPGRAPASVCSKAEGPDLSMSTAAKNLLAIPDKLEKIARTPVVVLTPVST